MYVSQSLSLAALETLVHAPPALLRTPWVALSADVPEELVEPQDRSALPPDWNAFPGPQEVQRIGDEWARSLSRAVLEVPSAVIPSESNYLLNPLHPDFARVIVAKKFLPFTFDRRLGTSAGTP